SGKIVYQRAYDLSQGREVPVPADLAQHLKPNDALAHHTSTKEHLSGILLLKEGPLLVSSYPILDSENHGPIRGTLIWAQYLDNQVLSQIGSTLLLPVELYPIHQTNL